MTLDVRILGPLELAVDGAPVALGGPRQRAVLALLVTRAGTLVPRDRLIDELWDDRPPESAVNVVQTYVSHLRKVLPPGRLATRPPGYALELAEGELDLHRFEALVDEGRRLLARADAEAAATALERALALWRGPALADLADTGFARVEAARLEELRLAAVEERVEADLARGRHDRVVGELDALVAAHPLRERLRAQQMLALYRCGRQAEALAAYRAVRAALVDGLGIEPGPGLRSLEAAILRHDPSLDPAAAPPGEATARPRSVVAVALDGGAGGVLLGLAEALGSRPGHDVVLVRLVSDAGRLDEAARAANAWRAAAGGRGGAARAVAFTSSDPVADAVRLASAPDVLLLLVDGADGVDADGRLDGWLASVLAEAPCDVAVVAGARGAPAPEPDAPVVVPFGGAEHEWAAAEVAAWIAGAESRPVELVGAAGDEAAGRRDATRLLASVALLLQQVATVDTRPRVVPAGRGGALLAAGGARVVVLGLPDDWPARGVGPTRAGLVRGTNVPVLLVRGGLRPGGLAPAEGLTRFTWTLTDHGR